MNAHESEVRIARMTAPQYAARVRDAAGILLPLGSTEILGQHGPLGADTLVADAMAPMIASGCQCLCASAVPFGDALELSRFPGTAHVPQRVLEDYLYAVASSSLFAPARAIVFLAFHSLNLRAADAVARRLRADGRRVVCADWWKAVAQESGDLLTDPATGRGHGGEMITSVVMRVAPDAVDLAAAANEVPLSGLARYAGRSLFGGDVAQAYGDFSDYCTSGAWGDVRGASAALGEALIQRAVSRLSDEIRALLA